MNNKKLCLLQGNYWGQCQGGAELQAHYLEQRAIEQEWQVHCCFMSNGNYISNYKGTMLCPITQKKIWSRFGNIKYPYAKIVLNTLNRIKPSAIYQRGGCAFTGLSAWYAQQNNCKFLFHLAHDRDPQKFGNLEIKPHQIPEYMLQRFGIQRASIVIAQTNFQAVQLKQNFKRDAVIIPNAHPVPQDHIKADDHKMIFWIANWKPIKQPELFIELAKRLSSVKAVKLKMIGRKDKYTELEAKAMNAGVKVTGELPNEEVNEMLSQGHILVNTSKQEGFSNTFIQAWMRKVPVVSLQVDPDSVLEKEGIGFCSGSFDQLVKDTQKLITDDKLRNEMGERARAYAIKNHSLKNMDKILDLMAE